MRVLVACEHSGAVRDAFAAKGHDAWSCDLLPSLTPGQHIQADVLSILDQGWDLMIAHPPCTYLTTAAVRHWKRPGWAEKQLEAARFFMTLYNAPIPRVCVENPRGAMARFFRKADQEIHPWMFGDSEMKRTGLWLRNLPKLFWLEGGLFNTAASRPAPLAFYSETSKQPGKARYFVDSGTKDPLIRSRTFPAIARAMADQWG